MHWSYVFLALTHRYMLAKHQTSEKNDDAYMRHQASVIRRDVIYASVNMVIGSGLSCVRRQAFT